MIRLVAGAATDVGQVRTVNEDEVLVAERLVAVADGMGGHRGGEIASAAALEAFRSSVVAPTAEDLVAAVEAANEAVLRRAAADPELSGMGTTLCALALLDAEGEDEAEVAIVNVGDSRAYLLAGEEFVQLSEDHSLVETLVREGQITADEAAAHPRRNVLTRALGIDADLDVDVWTVRPREGDRFLLCSDGLFNELHDDRISSVLRRLGDPGEAARELVRLANEEGGRDNITVVVVDVAGAGGDGAGLIGSRVERRSDPTTDLLGMGVAAGAAATADPGPPATVEDEPATPTTPRGRWWRVALFVVAVAGVFALAFGAIAYTARSSYYVGPDDAEVVVFRGRPGGLLWFDPTVQERTGIALDDLNETQLAFVESEETQPDLATANRAVANLRESLATTTTTTTLPPTTTAAPTTTPTTGAAPPGAP